MSLISFSKPSDADIIQKIIEKDNIISFVGKGSILQNIKETLYIRTVKVKLEKEEVLQKVIYAKKGITWLFKAIEILAPVNNSAMGKNK
jgi:hypothetical protein